MSKKKNNKLLKSFGFDDRSVAEKVLDNIRISNVNDVIEILLLDYLFEPNNDSLWASVEDFLSEIYKDVYLVRCSELENTPETIANDELKIRFVGIDEDFIVTIKKAPVKQLTFNLDMFLKNG